MLDYLNVALFNVQYFDDAIVAVTLFNSFMTGFPII